MADFQPFSQFTDSELMTFSDSSGSAANRGVIPVNHYPEFLAAKSESTKGDEKASEQQETSEPTAEDRSHDYTGLFSER
ncbi:hypothetical protein [Hoyosella subflava]|uniref:Uncharacterized protein n=1 Tax=Hoyosella subflava (strain DSM 45089 / JCM 17490 / NBRC 109087 / DQS3-9A1) TaxID=443218 RepID=F6EG83_HOYSD|nr:hypothetical protein [Hoyosella subflava]AEF39808.1 hypothetical protein AS9A_1356 [Hoyosella subflava DQS3-9A1]